MSVEPSQRKKGLNFGKDPDHCLDTQEVCLVKQYENYITDQKTANPALLIYKITKAAMNHLLHSNEGIQLTLVKER